MTSESKYKPPEWHTPSEKSYNLRRDTFLFWPGLPAYLLIGLNQKITPVSSAKLRRWIRIIDPTSPDFDLRPVTIHKIAPFRYSAKPSGPTIPPDSTVPLPPGDYGWTIDGYSCGQQYIYRPFYDVLTPLHPPSSFEEYRKEGEENIHFKDVEDIMKMNVFPPSFEESVFLRDARCFFTGTESKPDLSVSWIIPPAYLHMLTYPNPPTPSELDHFISILNACVIRKDLMALFLDNAFGVDVDDGYCLVVFRDIGSVQLPLKVARDESCSGPDDEFLREHFRWCLRVHLQGGDIGDEFSHHDIQHAAELLGLHGDEYDLAPLDDPRWQSRIGKEFLEVHLRQQLHRPTYDMDSD